MRILVTGGTGFVGSHIVEQLLNEKIIGKKDLEIFATRRYHLSRRDKIEQFEDQVKWLDCDITDSFSVFNMIEKLQPQQVFHMAAESFVSPSWDHPSRYMNVNYVGTLNLLEAIKRFSPETKILIPGSGEEYGKIDASKLPITSFTSLNPVNPYAVTKIAQDLISLVYYESYGTHVVRLRTFNHEGPRRERYFGIASFCYQIARIEAGIQEPTLRVGHLKDKRNFTHVRDIVKAYILAMEFAEPGKLYLVGSESKKNIATFEDIVNTLISGSTYKGSINISQHQEFIRPTQVPYLIADSSEFRSLTGWQEECDLDYILTDVMNYWRSRIKEHPHI